MKKFGLLIIIFASLTLAQPTDLIISEYVEGTSNNKAIELYNGTGLPIDLATGQYYIQMYFNGSASSSLNILLTGIANDDDVYVLAHASASAVILAVADQTNGSGWYNGDDAIVLRKGGTSGLIVDVLGQIGFDPGTEWGTGLNSTADNTLRRAAGTITGDTDPSNVFDPSIGWTGYAVDTFDGLGIPEPLPVELTSFSATTIGSTVKLSWNTATEINNYGFEVERKVGSLQSTVGNYEKIGFVNGNGNSNSPKSYSYEDKNITAGKYSYRLKQIDNDGQFEYSKAIEVDLNGVRKFELSQNYPNPFNPATTIRFNLPEAGNVKITLYNLLGQEIRTLVNGYKESGVHTINFDASDLNSGMYIYKIEAGSFVQTRKMTLIK